MYVCVTGLPVAHLFHEGRDKKIRLSGFYLRGGHMKVCLGEQLRLQKPFLSVICVCVLYIWQDRHVLAVPVCVHPSLAPGCLCMCSAFRTLTDRNSVARPRPATPG